PAGPEADQPPANPMDDRPVDVSLPPAPAPVTGGPAVTPLPAPAPAPAPRPAADIPVLAETGAGDPLTAAAFGAAMLLGGAVLYRRSRAS
ncbi:LPXTG cell wall anchor domain-containing protein, partial [Streptomyces sp. 12297]